MAAMTTVRPDVLDLQANNYRNSSSTSSYSRDEGLLVIPVMGPVGTRPVVVRVHAPVGYRKSEFEYSKLGAPPVYPAQADTESGDMLLVSEISMPAPVPSGNGIVFGVRGEYTFVQPGTGRSTEDSIVFDSHPFPSGVDVLGDQQPQVSNNMSLEDMLSAVWLRQDAPSPMFQSYNMLG